MTAAPDEAIEPRWGAMDAVIGWAGAMAVAVLGGSIVIALAGYGKQAGKTSALPLWVLAVGNIPLWVGMVAVALYLSRTRGTGPVRDYRLAISWADVPLGIAIGVASEFILVPLISTPWLWITNYSSHDLSKTADDLANKAHGFFPVLLLIGFVALIPPFVEELMYRGLVLRCFERQWGMGVAIVLSGLVFGAVHFSVVEFPALAVFGMVLAFAVWRTGRLGTSVIAHLSFNLGAVVAILHSR